MIYICTYSYQPTCIINTGFPLVIVIMKYLTRPRSANCAAVEMEGVMDIQGSLRLSLTERHVVRDIVKKHLMSVLSCTKRENVDAAFWTFGPYQHVATMGFEALTSRTDCLRRRPLGHCLNERDMQQVGK